MLSSNAPLPKTHLPCSRLRLAGPRFLKAVRRRCPSSSRGERHNEAYDSIGPLQRLHLRARRTTEKVRRERDPGGQCDQAAAREHGDPLAAHIPMLSAAAMGGGWTNLAMVEMPVWFETWPEVKTSAAALHTDDKARYRLVLCLRDPHADDLHRAAAPSPVP